MKVLLKSTVLASLTALAIGITGCSKESSVSVDDGSSGSMTYDTKPTNGVVAGQPWAFVSGVARPSAMDPDRLSISLYGIPVEDPCGFNFPEQQVMTSVPTRLGETILGEGEPMATVTFYNSADNSNLISLDGRIEITSYDAQQVSGRIVSVYDDQNQVNGIFSVTMCTN